MSPQTTTNTQNRQDLRQAALDALRCPDIDAKLQQTTDLFQSAAARPLNPVATIAAPSTDTLPGRPAQPRLIPPGDVPHRSPFTPMGRAALVHAICHIEFNAINLALDAIWRFPGMPTQFYLDWLRVAAEEAYHFGLLRDHLRTLPHPETGQRWNYGDFDAHDGLWDMCEKTANDVTARMALVPRTLEARGLDATPLIQAKLRKVNTPDALKACDLLDIILRDEVGHVAIGNHWYRYLCGLQNLDPAEHYVKLAKQYEAPRLRPPFNEEARRKAGFSQIELDYLLGA